MKQWRSAVFLGLLLGALTANAAVRPPATRSATLAWNAYPMPDIAGYVLYYGTNSHQYTGSFFVGNKPSITITGLVERTTYYFAVTMQTQLGLESGPSEEVAYTVPPLPEGNFNGLFYEADGIRTNSAGCFTVSVVAGKTFSGRLQMGSARYGFSGPLDGRSSGTTLIARRGAGPLTLSFSFEGEHASGLLSDGTWTAEVWGNRTPFGAKNPSPFAGNYNLVIPASLGSNAPAGDSFGIARMDANGLVRFAGSFADGTRVAQAAAVSQEGWWPFYAAPYRGRGLIIGWLSITNDPDHDVAGAITWIKPPDARARFYPGGFACEAEATGSKYVAPPAGSSLFANPNAIVTFNGGNLALDVTNVVVISGNKVIGQSGSGLTMSFSPATGVFSGRFVDPTAARALPFSGVFLPKAGVGRGFLLGTDKSSAARFAP